MYEHTKKVFESGLPLNKARKAIIMLHGRGATAESISALAGRLNLSDAAVLAPQASNNSWYPYSFMSPVSNNQPALSSALSVIDSLVKDVLAAGIPLHKIYFLGFSQGACLSLEYTARNAAGYGGLIAFTGGLIGAELMPANYKGDFLHMPTLITTGDPDPHVPLSRVQESVEIMEGMNAQITLRVYKGRVHTIQQQELDLANKLVLV